MASYTCNSHNVFYALLVSILAELADKLKGFEILIPTPALANFSLVVWVLGNPLGNLTYYSQIFKLNTVRFKTLYVHYVFMDHSNIFWVMANS